MKLFKLLKCLILNKHEYIVDMYFPKSKYLKGHCKVCGKKYIKVIINP